VNPVVYGLFRFPSSYRKFRRFRQIVGVLAKHGFADMAKRTGLRRAWLGMKLIVSLGKWKGEGPLSTGQRLRMVCEELGPTFVKFGQLLASRADLLPQDVTTELALLQDHVAPFPYEEVRRTIEDRFGLRVADIFKEFGETPIAAASIAQVHRAVLHDGTVVAVKVRRPNIEKLILRDLEVLHSLGVYIDGQMPELSHLHSTELVDEFARNITQEMDFRAEVRNMERFAANFENDPDLLIPAVVHQFSSEDIITMDYVDGIKVTNAEEIASLPISPEQIAKVGTRVLLKSIFEDRFFHADPHPGNFLVTRDGQVCLLDFGMMGHVEESRMEEMLSFMVALVSSDSEMLVHTILQAGLGPEDLNERSFRRDLELMMAQFSTCTLEDLNIEQLLRLATDVIFRHRIRLPADLLMVGRAITTMEGIAHDIYPAFVPLQAVQPYLMSLFLKRALDPTQHTGLIIDALLDWGAFLRSLPNELPPILKRLGKGEFKVILTEKPHPTAIKENNRRTNRLVAGFMGVSGAALSIHCLEHCTVLPGWVSATLLAGSVSLSLWVVASLLRRDGL